MSILSSLVRQAAPVVAKVAPFVGGVGGTVAGIAGSLIDRDTQRREAKEQIERINTMADMRFSDFGTGGGAVVVPPYRPQSTAQSGGGFFDTVGGFFRDAGGLVRDAFSSGIPQLFGVGGRTPSSVTQPAVSTSLNIGAQESQGSGSIQAGLGAFPALVSAGRNLIRSPLGQVGIGTGVGSALGLFDSSGRQMRITRKTKRLAQQAYALSMGDLSSATSLFQNLTGMSVSQMQFVQILTKRFRNDGAVITKAALRKTRSTIRKMKNMCDMYDDLRPAARRRTMKRAATSRTTLIKN